MSRLQGIYTAPLFREAHTSNRLVSQSRHTSSLCARKSYPFSQIFPQNRFKDPDKEGFLKILLGTEKILVNIILLFPQYILTSSL